jgi:putative phosphoesterase
MRKGPAAGASRTLPFCLQGNRLAKTTKSIGVLSDTHGLLRGEVKSRICGCDMILHAGDIGSPSVLRELRQIAEVVAVRGNVDAGPWANELRQEQYVEAGDRRLCLVHDIATLSLDPAAAGFHVVIYGHSHKPALEWKDGILYLNPGSAGPKRLHLPISMALLRLSAEEVVPELVELR